jgi:poly(A) polymerase
MSFLKSVLNLARTGSGKVGEVDFDDMKLLHKIMVQPHVGLALHVMERAGFFNELIPEVNDSQNIKTQKKFKKIWPHTIEVVSQADPKLEVRWAALFHDLGKATAFSIKNNKVTFWGHEKISAKIFNRFAKDTGIFSHYQRNKIYFLVSNLDHVEAYLPSWTDSAVRRFDKEMGSHLDDILLLSRADITTKNPKRKAKIINQIVELKERILKVREIDENAREKLPKGLGQKISEELSVPLGPQIGNMRKFLEGKIESSEISEGQDFMYYIQYLKENYVENSTDTEI